MVQPPFREYHLIDLDGDKIDGLRSIVGSHKDEFAENFLRSFKRLIPNRALQAST